MSGSAVATVSISVEHFRDEPERRRLVDLLKMALCVAPPQVLRVTYSWDETTPGLIAISATVRPYQPYWERPRTHDWWRGLP